MNYKVTLMVTVDAKGETENEAINNAVDTVYEAITGYDELRMTGICVDPRTNEYLVFKT